MPLLTADQVREALRGLPDHVAIQVLAAIEAARHLDAGRLLTAHLGYMEGGSVLAALVAQRLGKELS